MGWGGAGLGISHTRPAPFNFLNGTGMRIDFAKRGGVGMGATRPVTIPICVGLNVDEGLLDFVITVDWQENIRLFENVLLLGYIYNLFVLAKL